MYCKAGFTLFFFAISIATAHSQSLDGIYRGKRTLTGETERIPRADRCQATGSPIEFRVTGSIIETTAPRSGQVFSGPLAGDGSFRITGQQPSASPGRPIVLEWKGTLKNSRIEGTSSGLAGRECHYTFSASKQGRR